jgi:Lar family restriction alleviation protein
MPSKVINLDQKKIKPCPFCGSKDIVQKVGKTTIIECMNCHVFMFDVLDGMKRNVVSVWNRRYLA